MLDLNHVLATPGLDAQYFQGPAYNLNNPVTYGFFSISSIATGGVLTLSFASSNWQVGQALIIVGTFTTGSIAGYTPGAIYYIITVTSTTSITISATPGGAAVTSTASTGSPGVSSFIFANVQWQTWKKPRGVKWVYMLGVGGGASGGTGVITGTTSGGGAGGGSGSQTVVMVPAMMVPDTLYIMCGNGGYPQQTNSSLPGLPGTPTFVSIEPYLGMDLNKNILWANPGNVGGTGATTATGGVAGTAASAATIAYMPLAGRGFYNSIAGQAGTAGGASNATGGTLTPPTLGLMVTGGTGGGGCNGALALAGGNFASIITALGQDFFPALSGGSAAVTSTPAGNGLNGFIVRNFMFNYGGTGGGGATTNASGNVGAGGEGTPGCGGGGGGGANTTQGAQLKSGAGGVGFVLIASW
jgi:hypothetical protein